jgi:pescadillo protein
VSIKGYYFQADILGQPVTWIVPHTFGFQPQSPDEVDFRIMATFVEFYCTVLGFVNYRLFHSLNMCYPPKLVTLPSTTEGNKYKEVASEDELLSERVAALNQSLLRAQEGDNAETVPEMDEFESSDAADAEKIEELKREAARINRVKTLFEGEKFFLNREVPRESLTFVIRSAGGQVSWDKDLFAGATFDESEESITHQIVDRNIDGQKYLSRYYVQPQWVFDSINLGKKLPVENYFIGAILPPHVSPFLTEREGDYIPKEKRQFFDMENGLVSQTEEFNPTPQALQLNEKPTASDSEEEEEPESEENDEEDDDDEEERPKKQLKKEMKVKPGVPEVLDPIKQKADETKEEYTLRVMMIRNKHKRVYKRMMEARKRWRKEADKLTTKRRNLEGEGGGEIVKKNKTNGKKTGAN